MEIISGGFPGVCAECRGVGKKRLLSGLRPVRFSRAWLCPFKLWVFPFMTVFMNYNGSVRGNALPSSAVNELLRK